MPRVIDTKDCVLNRIIGDAHFICIFEKINFHYTLTKVTFKKRVGRQDKFLIWCSASGVFLTRGALIATRRAFIFSASPFKAHSNGVVALLSSRYSAVMLKDITQTLTLPSRLYTPSRRARLSEITDTPLTVHFMVTTSSKNDIVHIRKAPSACGSSFASLFADPLPPPPCTATNFFHLTRIMKHFN